MSDFAGTLLLRPVRSPASNNAFTLVELLVVIAIMSLLVTMLLPSFNQARNMSRIVACQANLHLHANMIQQYGADCKDFLPSPQTNHGLTRNGANYYTGPAISVYSNALLSPACPEDPTGVGANFPVNAGWFYWQGYIAPAADNSTRDPGYSPLPGMACPDAVPTRPFGGDMGQYHNASGTRNNLQINNGRMTQLANNFASHTTTYVPAGFFAKDCSEAAQEWDTSYIYRGWRYFTDTGGNYKMVPRMSNWKPSQVNVVDVKASVNTYWPSSATAVDKMRNWNLAHGENGMNMLYFDGHVAFGAPNLSTYGLVNQYSTSVPPYIYYLMKFQNVDAFTAFAVGQDSGGSGGNGAMLWNYYDSGIK